MLTGFQRLYRLSKQQELPFQSVQGPAYQPLANQPVQEALSHPAHNQINSGSLKIEPQYRQSGRTPDSTVTSSRSTPWKLLALPGVTIPSHFQ